MMSDKEFDRLMATMRAGEPSPDLANRIVEQAIALPQRRGFSWNAWLSSMTEELFATWPQGMAYKTAFMAVIAVLTFGAGVEQAMRQPGGESEVAALAVGDFDAMEGI